jgi:hypothetical protein
MFVAHLVGEMNIGRQSDGEAAIGFARDRLGQRSHIGLERLGGHFGPIVAAVDIGQQACDQKGNDEEAPEAPAQARGHAAGGPPPRRRRQGIGRGHDAPSNMR